MARARSFHSDPTARVERGKLVLSREVRERLFRGDDLPDITITGKVECPIKPPYGYTLSPKLKLVVTGIGKHPHGHHNLVYTVQDRRDPARLLRRTPGISDEGFDAIRRSFDEYGAPGEPTAGALERASEESSYTGAGSSLSDAGEAVNAHDQERITKRARKEASTERALRRKYQGLLGAEARAREFLREGAHRRIDMRNEQRLLDRLVRQGKPLDNVVQGMQRKLDRDVQLVKRKAA